MGESQQTLKKRATKRASQRASQKPYHHGDLRNALIVAGLQILAKDGVAALNLREVARRAGVSHAAPYRHFPDKQALIGAIAADGFRQLEAHVRKTLASAGRAATVTQKLVTIGQDYVQFALRHPDHFRVMFSTLRDQSSQPEMYVAAKASFILLAQIVSEGQGNSELIAGDPLQLSEALWVAMHGLAVLLLDGQINLSESKAKSVDELVKRHIEWQLSGLRGQREMK